MAWTMKETRKFKEQTVILIAWRHDEIAFLDNIFSHNQVAKDFLQTCPKNTTKYIGFYTLQSWRRLRGFLIFLIEKYEVNMEVKVKAYM